MRRIPFTVTASLMLMLFVPTLAQGAAKTGAGDRSFGHGGFVRTGDPKPGYLNCEATADSGLFMSIRTQTKRKVAVTSLTRLNKRGRRVRSFGNHGRITWRGSSAPFRTQAISGDRVLVSAWTNSQNNKPASWTVSRLTAQGELDFSFGTGGKITFDVAQTTTAPSAIELPNGRLIFVLSGSRLAAYDAAGQPDLSFGIAGVQQLSVPIGGISAFADGGLLISGARSVSKLADELFATRLLPNGATDTTWGVDGEFRQGAVPSSAYAGYNRDRGANSEPQAEFNHVVVASTTPDGGATFAVNTAFAEGENRDYGVAWSLRLSPDGKLDTNYGTDGAAFVATLDQYHPSDGEAVDSWFEQYSAVLAGGQVLDVTKVFARNDRLYVHVIGARGLTGKGEDPEFSVAHFDLASLAPSSDQSRLTICGFRKRHVVLARVHLTTN
jgi:uncharacterized delta-60 repeat protein